MEIAPTLYRLQQAELERADCAQRLAQAVAILGDSSQVETAAAQAKTAQVALTKAQAAVRELELQTQSVKAKRANTEERMFSGKVTNPKELASLQSESEALQRRIAKLEDDLLEALIALEEAQANADAASARLAEATAQREAQVADLTRQRGELEQRIAHLDATIAQIRASLTPDNLSLYEYLARRKGNRPVALLTRANVCGACGVSVPIAIAQQARDRSRVAFCPSCERILHVEG
ncbi:MAG: C4-type zinc ribbon domain-containing protein [Anaerolineae bacterium]|nr:C4-type zinc ribbon domain-containing protein [Anaerolineae bacterium]